MYKNSASVARIMMTVATEPHVASALSSASGCSLSQLADALAECVSSVSTATDVSQCLTKSNRENESLQKQLNDLGHQSCCVTTQQPRLFSSLTSFAISPPPTTTTTRSENVRPSGDPDNATLLLLQIYALSSRPHTPLYARLP
jgi:hypothetical protein